MKPALKPGDIVEYTGRNQTTCVARVKEITTTGFNMQVILLAGKEYKEKKVIPVLNAQWETADFRIRLQLIK